MTRTEDTERAEFETTRRLLAGLINEGLVDYSLRRLGPPKQSTLCLQAAGLDCKKSPTSHIVVGINSNALVDENGNVLCPIAAEQLELPVWLEYSNGPIFYETNPSKILQAIHEWIPGLIPDDLFLEKAKAKFQSCVDNQSEAIHSDAPSMCT
jgi:hypothetical protein